MVVFRFVLFFLSYFDFYSNVHEGAGGSLKYLFQHMIIVLVRVTINVTEHHGLSNLRRKGFIQLAFPHHNSTSKKVRIGSQAGQEPGGMS